MLIGPSGAARKDLRPNATSPARRASLPPRLRPRPASAKSPKQVAPDPLMRASRQPGCARRAASTVADLRRHARSPAPPGRCRWLPSAAAKARASVGPVGHGIGGEKACPGRGPRAKDRGRRAGDAGIDQHQPEPRQRRHRREHLADAGHARRRAAPGRPAHPRPAKRQRSRQALIGRHHSPRAGPAAAAPPPHRRSRRRCRRPPADSSPASARPAARRRPPRPEPAPPAARDCRPRPPKPAPNGPVDRQRQVRRRRAPSAGRRYRRRRRGCRAGDSRPPAARPHGA